MESVTADPPFIDVSFSPPGNSDVYQFTAKIDADQAIPGRLSGTITIRTNDARFPELHVPVHGEIC